MRFHPSFSFSFCVCRLTVIGHGTSHFPLHLHNPVSNSYKSPLSPFPPAEIRFGRSALFTLYIGQICPSCHCKFKKIKGKIKGVSFREVSFHEPYSKHYRTCLQCKNYLQRCIDSILHQEYTDYELFLVDDGSTDGSGDICDAYAAADARITVIHKENTGVSDSRNLAISQARGTYLQFLDSDDWITPDATKLFVRAATEHDCDLVIADFYRVVGERVSHKGRY